MANEHNDHLALIGNCNTVSTAQVMLSVRRRFNNNYYSYLAESFSLSLCD